MKKRIKIKQDPSRYLLSDVLPFEIPVSISNRGFVRFLLKNKISFSFEKTKLTIYMKQSNKDIQEIILLLFSTLFQQNDLKILSEKGKTTIIGDIDLNKTSTIPYFFKICSGTGKIRELAYVHPLAQIIAMAFNERYKGLILNYCTKSNFTIRAPRKIAKTRFYNDYSHFLSKTEFEISSKIEEIGKEYETIKSYYVYYRYSNIYKFYESNLHHKLERKFCKLSKLDISSCFDTIYTHSIAWAIYGKEQTKDKKEASKFSFPGLFDSIMQKMNYNETHGIVIGPEFSRIFAEIILQRIDYDVEKDLEHNKYLHNFDYTILRFVDDYFVFYNDPKVFEKIKEAFICHLREYKLSLNTAKESISERPHITSITIAKKNLNTLFNNFFSVTYCVKDKNSSTQSFYVPYINKDKFISEIKSIIYQYDVKYGEICNFFLSALEKNVNKLLQQWHNCAQEISKKGTIKDKETLKTKATELSKYCFESIVDIIFFVLSMDVQINAAIIASRIINSMILTIKNTRSKYSFAEIPQTEFYRHIIYNIESWIRMMPSDNEAKRTFALHLLNIAAELEDGYYLESSTLEKIIGQSETVDYLVIVVLLRYIKNIRKYTALKNTILDNIKQKAFLNNKRNTLPSLLFLDLLSCPYIENKEKETLFDTYTTVYSIPIPSSINKTNYIKFIESNRISFTCWNWTSFAKELAYKRADIVY